MPRMCVPHHEVWRGFWSDVIRTEVWPFCRTTSSVRLWWKLEEHNGPKGSVRDPRCMLSNSDAKAGGTLVPSVGGGHSGHEGSNDAGMQVVSSGAGRTVGRGRYGLSRSFSLSRALSDLLARGTYGGARPFYRTISSVRLCWELQEPKGPKGTYGIAEDREARAGVADHPRAHRPRVQPHPQLRWLP